MKLASSSTALLISSLSALLPSAHAASSLEAEVREFEGTYRLVSCDGPSLQTAGEELKIEVFNSSQANVEPQIHTVSMTSRDGIISFEVEKRGVKAGSSPYSRDSWGCGWNSGKVDFQRGRIKTESKNTWWGLCLPTNWQEFQTHNELSLLPGGDLQWRKLRKHHGADTAGSDYERTCTYSRE